MSSQICAQVEGESAGSFVAPVVAGQVYSRMTVPVVEAVLPPSLFVLGASPVQTAELLPPSTAVGGAFLVPLRFHV